MRKQQKRLILGISLVLLLIILVILGVNRGKNSSGFCVSCHIMRPEVMTWQVSSHRKVPCTTCHVASDFKHPLQALVRIIYRTNVTRNKTYLLPVVPHAQHNEVGVQCTDCHQGTVHGRITERNRTTSGNFEQWTPEMASGEMIPQYRRIGMKECIDCHGERNLGVYLFGRGDKGKWIATSHRQRMRN